MMPIESPANPPTQTAAANQDPGRSTHEAYAPAMFSPVPSVRADAAIPPRRPGRPLEMSAEEVLREIRVRAQQRDGLFRVHLESPALYARARRMFGSWSAAVRGAGLDYETLQGVARSRSLQTRRRNRRGARTAVGAGRR